MIRAQNNARPIVIAAILLATLLAVASLAKADYVIQFSEESYCVPCRQQAPVVEALKTQGYDIRVVKPSEQPALKAYYRVRRVPTAVYVMESPNGLSYDSGRRLVGVTSVEQLRAFCDPNRVVLVPAYTTVTVLGIPILFW